VRVLLFFFHQGFEGLLRDHQLDKACPGYVREGFGVTSEEFGGPTAQTQTEVDQDGQGETDTGTTSDQEDALEYSTQSVLVTKPKRPLTKVRRITPQAGG
jgi:hypothetical protein